MSTLTIQMKDEQIAELRARSSRFGLSPEIYVQKCLEHLLESTTESGIAWADATTFERALSESIRENDELYRRLAQ